MSGDREPSAWGRFVSWVLGNRRDKAEWQQYKARVQVLPDSYRLVMEKVQQFLWTAGGAVDEQSYRVLYDICEVFEEAAAANRPVLDVTGDDVAQFALDMLAATQAKTWRGQKADQLNASVHKLLGAQDGR